MYFSEITKGLAGTFGDRNQSCRQAVFELQKQSLHEEETKEESKAQVTAEVVDFATLMKRKAEAAKNAKDTKGKGKPAP